MSGIAEPRRIGRTASAIALLLAVGSAAALAQSSTGSLAGKLTDLYSRPIDGATLVLRNEATGVEARTTTSKNGSYRFDSLAPGEYMLEAGSPGRGSGHLRGIFVSGGNEARVQAALELDRQTLEPPVSPPRVQSFTDPAKIIPGAALDVAGTPASRLLKPPAEQPSTVSITSAANLPFENVALFPLKTKSPTETMPKASSPPPPISGRNTTAELHLGTNPPSDSEIRKSVDQPLTAPAVPAPFSLAVVKDSVSAGVNSALLVLAARPLAVNGGGFAVAAIGAVNIAWQLQQAFPGQIPHGAPSIDLTAPTTLTGEQLQALPFQGRHWENFALDASASAATAEEDKPDSPRTGGPQSPAVSVDGASTRLAFGSRMRGSSLMGPSTNEAAIGQVRTSAKGEATEDSNGGRDKLDTRRGSIGLHGQGFVFDRRNVWGAQNPFTQWVKETGPAALATAPVFTPLPYTAPDSEIRWGVGVGSRIRRSRLFWFAALDGSQRSNPGVAMVKHPDSFFAQPRNDEMQVLSARLGLSSVNPVAEGLAAYSAMLNTLSGLLGPAPRTANQWVGFGRLDWKMAERHSFTLEGTGARWNSPGGGLTRTAEPYGNHSFGTSRASELWLLGRWEAFLTPNLLAVTQGSVGRHILAESAESPSPFEQSLNVSAWGHLPQIVVDSRYGFTIGNPSRFGTGSYPDEHLYEVREDLDWVHGGLLVKAGAEWRHNADATGMVRNHGGTYHYSTVENFASDALVFAQFGLSNALDPMNQHNCDQRGKAWRDTSNQLHGLGYLPCYSYYSQTMGPANWHLSTNDMAGYATAQWQPAKRFVMSASLRWAREFLPPPIALVNNPALPLTQKLPTLGSEWGPRASLAWGSGESHWPTLRLGYGMYFGRTQNSVLETALTQTGSLKGDLNFFMRPTDNLVAGGAPPFPYVLAGEPATVVKPGAVEFAPNYRNPEIHQGEATVEESLPGHVQVTASAIVSLGRRLPVTIDTNFDPTTNPGTITYGVVDGLGAGPIKAPRITVPFFASWPASGSTPGSSGRLNDSYQQITELMSRANSTYEAAMLRVSRSSRRGLSFHARYTYGHAMDWNPNESTQVSGSGVLDPTDFAQEYGTSSLDVRHSASAMFIWQAPWKLRGLQGRLGNGWMLSGTGQFHSGLPYTMRTSGSIPEEIEASGAAIVGLGPGMNGSGGDNRVYGIGRNTYRYPSTWKADVRLGRKINLGHTRELELMAESFNLFNHQNVTQIETTGYYISTGNTAGSLPTLNFLTGLKTGQTEFGKPLDINATDFYRPRQFDFGLRMRF
jgi:Carboxypeptidase regulatory-like domain